MKQQKIRTRMVFFPKLLGTASLSAYLLPFSRFHKKIGQGA